MHVIVLLRFFMYHSVLTSAKSFYTCYIDTLSFRTSADLDGVERLSVMAPDSSFLNEPYDELPHLDGRCHILRSQCSLACWLTCFLKL